MYLVDEGTPRLSRCALLEYMVYPNERFLCSSTGYCGQGAIKQQSVLIELPHDIVYLCRRVR